MSDEITEPTVHLCWNEHAIRRAAEVLEANGLQLMASHLEAHLKPPVDEPSEFGSVVRATNPDGERHLWVQTGGDPDYLHNWISEGERESRRWSQLSDPEVLRVGIGEAKPTPAEIEQVIHDVTEKERGHHTADVAERVAREVVGRLVQGLPATMFRTRDVDIEPEPDHVRRFCSLRRDCRMADGHQGGCNP